MTGAKRCIEIGIDTGGTFTDLVCRMGDGIERAIKVPSTPTNPGDAIVNALKQASLRWSFELTEVSRLVHGTTVGTNAVLERKGAKIGLLTTNGFSDLLEIGRQVRSPMYSIKPTTLSPKFMLPRDRVRGVVERISASGEVLVQLDEVALLEHVKSLVDQGITSLSVSYLFSFVNPVHERRTFELVSEHFPHLHISLSSEVDPNFREYERTLATSFDAYVKPVVGSYLDNINARVQELGVPVPMQLMQSRGGICSADVAKTRPIRLFLSGPAGGVIGAREAGVGSGETNLITIDIGGTSSDIAVISNGEPSIISEGRISGWPVRIPMVGVHAIGAGGGSIAWIDAAGGLRVGPHSAGAMPGPACYSRGGTLPTVTDASVILGYLNPGNFADGSMSLNADLARSAVRDVIATPLGLSIEAAALGIHRVINAQMAEGVKLMSVNEGRDPREFVLVPLGGAGPVHGTALAEELGMDRVLIPRFPGVLAATGLLSAPVEHENAIAYNVSLARLDKADLFRTFAELDEKTSALMDQENTAGYAVNVKHYCEMCYVGQSFSLEVDIDITDEVFETKIVSDFNAVHEKVFGYSSDAPVKLTKVRTVHTVNLEEYSNSNSISDGSAADDNFRDAVFQSGTYTCKVFKRHKLNVGFKAMGPLIVEHSDTTTVVGPNWELEVLNSGSMMIKRAK